jgi:hypothetical protein
MSNKKETPVSWLMEAITYDNGYGERHASFIETVDLFEYFDKALQMESQKQQKYNEMLEMLKKAERTLREVYQCDNKEIQQLIKSATEL